MKHIHQIIILLLLTLLSSVSGLAIADAENASITRVSGSEKNNGNVKEIELKKAMAAYQISLSLNMTFNELNRINNGVLKSEQILQVGEKIMVPQSASLTSVSSSSGDYNLVVEPQNTSALPVLGGKVAEQNSLLEKALSYTPGNEYINGSTEQNVASALNTVATEDWENFKFENIIDNAETKIKNQVKSDITNKVTETAENFLGRFGKAEVNLSVDEKGNLAGSSINLLSPIIDSDKSLFFSQVGVHGQGSGDDTRTIGNFGLGYRYEQEEWLAGANVFIDHDFTGSNTRLGLGGEYWRNNFKLSTNLYTPLSGWKESEVMKNYEVLIYDERPARGFDVRAQGYLPSYPQLGGSLVYEQYFGDEVALFGTENRQKDPYALTVGLDYTPIPLLTSKLSHKVGKDGQNETRFDLNLNVQLGTPIEEQLDPANVALARSLKGSRYDMVDRNYDIVFEYKKEDFSVKISTDTSAKLINQPISIQGVVNSRSPINSYKWIIDKAQNGVITNLSEHKTSSANFDLIATTPGLYFVTLEVATERGYVARSNTLQIMVEVARTNSQFAFIGESMAKVLTQEEAENFKGFVPEETFIQLMSKKKLKLRFTAENVDGSSANFIDTPSPVLEISRDGHTLLNAEQILDLGIAYVSVTSESNPNEVDYYVVADEHVLAGVLGQGLQTELYFIINFNGEYLSLKGTFEKDEQNENQEAIDPNFVRFEIFEVDAKGDAIDGSRMVSGAINGIAYSSGNNMDFKTDRYYRAKVILIDPSTKEEKDITEWVMDSMIWLYWSPESNNGKGEEISVERLIGGVSYRALEGCDGSNVFRTQITNYQFNELAWGKILDEHDGSVVTEQGLQLAVQFDYKRINKERNAQIKVCEPASKQEEVAEAQYDGFVNNDPNKVKAIAWSEVE